MKKIGAVEELRGLLAPGVLPEILRRIFLERRFGLLHLACGVERSDIEFSDGYCTHAATSLPGANLGDLLIQSGLLAARDRDACIEIAALSGERLGETLVRHGLIDVDQLTQGLALQVREVLTRTLSWTGGVYTFTDASTKKPVSLDGPSDARLDPREVLLDATWALANDPALDGLVGDLKRKVRKASDERLLYIDFRLTPADAFLLSQVDGVLTGEALLLLSPASPQEAKATLAGLLAVGAIEYAGATAPTSMTTQVGRLEVARVAARLNASDPYEVLGLAADVSDRDLRSTYVRLLRTCDPASTTDAEFRPILQKMCEQLAEAFKEIERRRGTPRAAPLKKHSDRRTTTVPRPASRAHVSMTPPVLSSPPPALLAKPEPKPASPAPPAGPMVEPSQANEAAARAFEGGRFHEALAILHEAIPQLSGHPLRSARVRKARVLLAVENGAKLAEEELKAAIAEDQGNADAHAALGSIYQERGSLAMAMMEYRKALQIQPKNAAAREALDELRAVPGDKPREGSVLKKLFGR